jgi:hypothetical protein
LAGLVGQADSLPISAIHYDYTGAVTSLELASATSMTAAQREVTRTAFV